MNASRIARLALLLVMAPCPSLFAETAEQPPDCDDGQLALMILGTYHMANPGLDAIDMAADDVLSARRQAELENLSERLARFAPDRVLVEAAFGNTRIHENYRAYLDDEFELTRNEIYQIGYRLARRLGHDSVYPIDYPMFQDGTALEFYLARYPDAAQAGKDFSAGWQGLADADARRLRDSTIAEYLLYLNDPGHWTYGLDSRYVLATSIRYAANDQYAGADILTSWYKRNLRMLTNVHRSVTETDSRALLLVGSGHNKILRDLVDTSPLLCRVDPGPYLAQ